MSFEPEIQRGPSLRIVCLNDVYTLENLPRFVNLVRHHRQTAPADRFLLTLAGDFVGPSMLSSLDKGRSMIECLNAMGVTHVIFGNHEDDIELEDLQKRVREFSGVWLSTNLSDFDPKLPRHDLIVLEQPTGRTVKVGLVGAVMDDPTVYRRKPFGGAPIAPLAASVLAETAKLVRDEGVACVIPLTHQDLQDDRVLAQTKIDPPFPVIIGGHEHKIYLEHYGKTWLVKAGCDAAHAVILDLEWPAQKPSKGADLPIVKMTLDDVARYPEDPDLRALVNRRMLAVKELEAATLLPLAENVVLSSIGSRLHQTSVGTLLCSRIRDALSAEGCLLNGGGVRGNREYRGAFTYGNLKAELPFDNEVVVVELSGSALQEAIVFSRSQAPVESGGYLQVDDRIEASEDQKRIISVAGQPFDPDRLYKIAIMRNLMIGMDHIDPLVDYAKNHPTRLPPEGSGRDIKMVLVDAFSVSLWQQLGQFAGIDSDGDGSVSASELAHAVSRVTAQPASPITVDLVMKAVDQNHDGVISEDESAALHRR